MSTAIQDISREAVAADRYDLWGVQINNYKVDGQDVDFETLMVTVSANRAVLIEQEVVPLSTLVTNRNTRLTNLGNALANLTSIQQSFPADTKGDTVASTNTLDDATLQILIELKPGSNQSYWCVASGSTLTRTMYPSRCEEAIQLVKTEMDRLNNESQADMTRLQSLVSKRDESFTTASTMMTSISDTRSNAIKAIGG